MRSIGFIFLLGVLGLGSCRSQSEIAEQENAIVLVNTGSFNKRNITQEIEILNQLNAKVISLDIAFTDYIGDKDDKNLIAAIEQRKNVVLPTIIHSYGKDYHGNEMIDVVRTYALPVVPVYVKDGFVTAEKEDNDRTRIPGQFIVWQKGNSGDIYYHFSVVTAMSYDSMKAVKYVEGHPQTVDVDFRVRKQFKIFTGLDLRRGKVTKADIEGKIVVMGFLGPGDTDKFVSPLNTNNTKPDMYGMEYLAQIIAQILFQ
jgi:CHASE2 domain-containing sensor protein